MSVEHGALTFDQILDVAKIGLARKPPPMLLNGALRVFLDVLAPKWVRDFIFSPSPIHLPHLASPLLSTTAITCATTWIGVAPVGPPPHAMPYFDGSYHYNGNLLFVPTFTSGNTVVGVGVFRALGSSVIPWCAKSDKGGEITFDMRFVLDTRRHIMVLVMDVKEDDLFYVISEVAISTTEAKLFTGFFHSSLREEALRETNELRIEHVFPKLVHSQDEIHESLCFVCKASPLAGCDCQLPFPISCQPFDREHIFQSLSLHGGFSQGIASQTTYEGGVPKATVTIGSHAAMEGVIDMDLIQMLSNWSISDHAKRSRPDPLQSVFLNGPIRDGPLQDTAMCLENDSDSALDSGLQSLESLLELLPTSPRRRQLLDKPSNSSMESDVPTFPVGGEQSAKEVGVVSVTNSFLNGDWLDFQVSIPEGDPGTSCSEESVQYGRKLQEGSQVAPTIDETGQVEGVSQGEKAVQRQPAVQVTRPAGAPRWILPRPGDCVALEDTESPAELVRRMKQEEKKERNRASARRSNEKKKIYREQLKSDLAINHERISELRKQEMELREENQRLRKSVHDTSIK